MHVPAEYRNPLQDAIGSFAYVCVTLFFLISAYGMMLSGERKDDYLKHFWGNRLVALLVPCLMVNIAALCLKAASTGEWIFAILKDINYYVVILLQWCVWFYIVMLCRKKWFTNNTMLADALLLGGVLLSSLYSYFFIEAEVSANSGWPFERMGLIWGVLLYRHFDCIKEWMNKNRWVKVALLTVVGGILGVAYLKFKTVYFWGEYLLKIILGLALIMLLFIATSNRHFGNKASYWLGDISYEVYLAHHAVMAALAVWLGSAVDSGEFILLTVVCTFVIATIAHEAGKPIMKQLRK